MEDGVDVCGLNIVTDCGFDLDVASIIYEIRSFGKLGITPTTTDCRLLAVTKMTPTCFIDNSCVRDSDVSPFNEKCHSMTLFSTLVGTGIVVINWGFLIGKINLNLEERPYLCNLRNKIWFEDKEPRS